jgi:hypothetical protein
MTDKWMKEIWCIHIMEYYPAIKKKNEIMLFEGKQMELETMILSETSLAQKDKYHIFSFICRI